MSRFHKDGAVRETVVAALTRPRSFFRRRDPSLRTGAGVVVAAAGVRLLAVLPVFYAFRFFMTTRKFATLVAFGGGFFLVYSLLRWIVLAGVIHAAVRLLGGERSFRNLLAYLGWSHLPNLLGGAVVFVLLGGAVLTVSTPGNESEAARFAVGLSTSPLVKLSSAYGFVEARTGFSLNQLQYVLGVTQFAWAAAIWVAAVQVTSGLDDRRTLLAVALPVIVGGLVVGFPGFDIGISI
jgi:hypothetical protein